MLFEIGSYDDSTAYLESLTPVKMLAAGSDLVDVNPKVPEIGLTGLEFAGDGKK